MERYAGTDGSCIFLKDSLCTIYDERPLICNVARVYEVAFKDVMSEEAFYEMTEEACRKLRNESVSKEEGTDET